MKGYNIFVHYVPFVPILPPMNALRIGHIQLAMPPNGEGEARAFGGLVGYDRRCKTGAFGQSWRLLVS